MKFPAHVLLMCLPIALPAAVIVNLQEVGSDLVLSASGTLDTSGLTLGGNTSYNPYLYPQSGALVTGAGGAASYFTGSTLTGGSFGSGGYTPASSGLGDLIYVSTAYIGVSSSYVSGAALSASNTYTGASIASLGLVEGSYTWTWSSDSITLIIGSSMIPEPSSYALLFGAATLGFCTLRRSRRA